MTYQAAFWHPNAPSPSIERALEDAEIGRYVNGWGGAGDAAVIAELALGGHAVGLRGELARSSNARAAADVDRRAAQGLSHPTCAEGLAVRGPPRRAEIRRALPR